MWGIPMWAFYIKRAQCITSMGLKDKDNAIVEFQSFNKALQSVDRLGFRTFLKTGDGVLCGRARTIRNPQLHQ